MPHRPPERIPEGHRPPRPAPDIHTVRLPEVLPDQHLRRDHAVARLALKKRLTLQGAADELGEVMKSVDAVTHAIIHGPGPVVPGPSTLPPDK
jgi:hypothetical protein